MRVQNKRKNRRRGKGNSLFCGELPGLGRGQDGYRDRSMGQAERPRQNGGVRGGIKKTPKFQSSSNKNGGGGGGKKIFLERGEKMTAPP